MGSITAKSKVGGSSKGRGWNTMCNSVKEGHVLAMVRNVAWLHRLLEFKLSMEFMIILSDCKGSMGLMNISSDCRLRNE